MRVTWARSSCNRRKLRTPKRASRWPSARRVTSTSQRRGRAGGRRSGDWNGKTPEVLAAWSNGYSTAQSCRRLTRLPSGTIKGRCRRAPSDAHLGVVVGLLVPVDYGERKVALMEQPPTIQQTSFAGGGDGRWGCRSLPKHSDGAGADSERGEESPEAKRCLPVGNPLIGAVWLAHRQALAGSDSANRDPAPRR